MAINHLKSEIDRVLRLIEQEGRPFQFAALTPAYPGMADTSFVLQVRADWISRPNQMEGLRYLIQKLYDNLGANTLRYLNRVGVPYGRGGYFS